MWKGRALRARLSVFLSVFSVERVRKLLNTPIAYAEAIFHQREVRRRAHRTVRMLMIAFLILLAISLAIALVNRASLLPDPLELPDTLPEIVQERLQQLSTFLLMWIAGAQYLLAMSLAAQSGMSSILHERRSRTWESLILTGVDARQMITGKWIATLRTMWTVYGGLLLPRAAAMAWYVFVALYPLLQDEIPNLFIASLVTAAALAVVFPLVSLALITAMGVLASLIGRSEALSRIITGGMIVGSMVVLYVLFGLLLLLPLDSEWVSALMSMPFAVFDGGVITMFVLAEATAREMFGVHFVGAGLVYVVTSGGLIWLILRAAEWAAVRQNVSARERSTGFWGRDLGSMFGNKGMFRAKFSTLLLKIFEVR